MGNRSLIGRRGSKGREPSGLALDQTSSVANHLQLLTAEQAAAPTEGAKGEIERQMISMWSVSFAHDRSKELLLTSEPERVRLLLGRSSHDWTNGIRERNKDDYGGLGFDNSLYRYTMKKEGI